MSGRVAEPVVRDMVRRHDVIGIVHAGELGAPVEMLLGPFQMGRNSERLIVGPPEQVDACGALGLMKVRRGMPMQRGHQIGPVGSDAAPKWTGRSAWRAMCTPALHAFDEEGDVEVLLF